MNRTFAAQESIPILSRGKHRNARRGACFMEMASYLAGERWTDHPACTHPLLADLARLVNDSVCDASRAKLLPMIQSVIGLTSHDLHMDAAIALRSALAALPIATESQKHVLETGVLACERFVAGLDYRDANSRSPQSGRNQYSFFGAESWSWDFLSSGQWVSQRRFREQTAPQILNIAVESIAHSAVPDVEQRLIDLLAATIAECGAYATSTDSNRQAYAAHA